MTGFSTSRRQLCQARLPFPPPQSRSFARAIASRLDKGDGCPPPLYHSSAPRGSRKILPFWQLPPQPGYPRFRLCRLPPALPASTVSPMIFSPAKFLKPDRILSPGCAPALDSTAPASPAFRVLPHFPGTASRKYPPDRHPAFLGRTPSLGIPNAISGADPASHTLNLRKEDS